MRSFFKTEMDMTSGPLVGKIIRFAVPLFLSGVLQVSFNAADSIVVGQFAGANALAAIGATNSIYNLMINLFVGLASGSAIAIAHAIGAKDDKNASEFAHCAISTAVIVGVFVAVVGIIFSRQLLELIGVPEEIMEDALVYFRLHIGSAPVILLYNYSAAVLRTTGDTSRPFIFLLIAGIANVLFNLFFVLVFHMDVAGVAIATLISNIISASLTILTLTRSESSCKIYIKKLRFYPKKFLQLLRYGLPISLQSCLFSISNTIFQSTVNSFGPAAIAGSSIATSIEGYLSQVTSAFQNAAMTFAGQNYGAKKADRLKKVCLYTHFIGGAFAVVAIAIVFIFRGFLFGLFVQDSPETLYYANLRSTYTLLPYHLALIQSIGTGYLRGLGKTTVPMFLSIFFVCIARVIWIYTIFPMYNSLEGLYVAYPITWGLLGISLLIFEIIEYKKAKKKFASEGGINK